MENKVTKIDAAIRDVEAHLESPTCVKQEEPKQETLEEAAESRFGTDMDSIRGSNVYDLNTDLKRGFIEGAKWQSERMGLMEIELNHTKTLLASCEKALEDRDKQAERMYSEENLREAFRQSRQAKIFEKDMPPVYNEFEEWFEQFCKLKNG